MLATKMRMSVTKQFRFEAAHHLPGYDGPCAELHGHSYLLEVTVTSDSFKDDMVMDFVALKKLVQPFIEQLDHHYLNDLMERPTAEALLYWLGTELRVLDKRVWKLKLWETATSYAEIEFGNLEPLR